MIGAGGPRHVLKTAAHAAGAATSRGVDLYVVEGRAECQARHLLFIALMTDEELPRGERMEMYLELYGNVRLRERTTEYLTGLVAHLRKFVADDEPWRLGEYVDLSHLKFKERDALEDVFRSWLPDVEFDVRMLRDERMRRYYAERYDHRSNLFDWDLSMKLVPMGHSIVHRHHWSFWRENGQAFHVRDSDYPDPNRTMLTFAKHKSVAVRGFWGDIVNSPYIAFGLEADDASLFEKRSEQHVKSATDVSEYNVDKLLGMLEAAEPGRWKVHLLGWMGADMAATMAKKAKYQNRFDVVYTGSQAVQIAAQSALRPCLRPGAAAVVETCRYLLDLRDEQKDAYVEKVTAMPGWTKVDGSSENEDANSGHLVFAYEDGASGDQ